MRQSTGRRRWHVPGWRGPVAGPGAWWRDRHSRTRPRPTISRRKFHSAIFHKIDTLNKTHAVFQDVCKTQLTFDRRVRQGIIPICKIMTQGEGMINFQLFAVTEGGLQELPVPPHATTFEELYPGLSLGVYSALRTFDHNRFLDLDAHLARTYQSIRLLGWDYLFDEAAFRQGLHDACTRFPYPEARVRFDVLAEPATPLGTVSRVLIALQPFTPPTKEMISNGVKLGFAPTLHRDEPLIKRADFPLKRRIYPIGGPDAYENLLTDEAGYLLEGTSSNFYAVKDDVLYTAGSGVLEGITRKIILNLLPDLGIPFRLEAVHEDEVDKLDEAAISSASRALLPVVQIGEQVIGTGQPGLICQQILVAYNEYVARHIKRAVEE